MSTAAPARTPARNVALADLGPLAQLRTGRLVRRLVQVTIGLALYGVSLGLMVQGMLGLAPWDVLHLAVADRIPLTLGQVIIAVSFVVLLLWIPLREKPGVGTIMNGILVGLFADLTIALVPAPDALAPRAALMVGGVWLCGLAGALYIGAQLGRGPRDGLMTGLHLRTGLSLRLVRTGLEVGVVVIGLLIGGTAAFADGLGTQIGVGTVLYALTIGPLTQAMLPWFLVRLDVPQPQGVPET